MSTTSVAVVYAVMLEFGFNATDYGKTRARGLLHHRPGHGASRWASSSRRSPARRWCSSAPVLRRLRAAAVGHAALLPALRRPALGTGSQVPA
ncbi:MAG: hypothetical protein MZV65_22105 [Chromatiales bacterium]|nr:hypothetical protein [Chromatiales bacterium]